MKYYYKCTYFPESKTQKKCLEECPFKYGKIGSFYCIRGCGLWNDYNINESWIDCDKLLVKIRKRKLKSIKL
jgi:hypothetical protein